MLMAADIPLFKQLDVHGYWLSGESKMSKSLGNVVRPLIFDKQFGIENLRYFFFKEMKFGTDSNFTYELFVERYNSDLANGLGNLLSRTAGLVFKNFGQIPELLPITKSEEAIVRQVNNILKPYREHFENREFHLAIEEVRTLLGETDKYITQMAPWKMAKEENQRDNLARVLFTGLEVVRTAAVLLYPFMPQKTVKILKYLGENSPLDGSLPIESLISFGKLKSGTEITKPPQFFPRIDDKKLSMVMTQSSSKQSESQKQKQNEILDPLKDEITIDDFAKIDLRTGIILEGHNVEGAKKLIRLIVDLGEENPRQIFAGIKSHYQNPEDLVGQKVIVVANLKPRQMKFGLSEGMILAASSRDKKRLCIATFKGELKGGETVS
jgi:methionyl-tRNA synthetase